MNAPAEHLATPLIGRTLCDAYRITAELGGGAMGMVYEAEQIRLKRTVAVKILADKYRGNLAVLRRFHNEARALVMLDHRNVVRIIDFAIAPDGRPFLVMERLHGTTVGNILEARRRFSVEGTLAIAAQVCDALVEAHSQGIFHRDLKPENLFLVDTPAGETFVKVLDFGICRLPESEGPRVTSNSEVLGTPEYMSPEQAMGLGDRVTGRADQHALAVVMYEMLSGVSPFASDDVQEALEKVSFHMPPLVGTLVPNVPESLSRVLHRALSKDPHERFPGIDAFVKAARAAADDGKPHSIIPVSRSTRPKTLPLSATFSVDDPIRTMALLLGRIRQQALSGDVESAAALAATALDATAVSHDEAVLALVDVARPVLEGVFHKLLEPVDRRVVARPSPAIVGRGLSEAQRALLAAIKPQTTIADLLHGANMPRLDVVRALVELESLGALEFRLAVPRPRSYEPPAPTSRAPVSAQAARRLREA